ncbi:MAG: hypothetical protein RLZ12_796 [Bacillota bacterium]
MQIKKTPLSGCFYFEVEEIRDNRGFFARRFGCDDLARYDLTADFVQGNLSFNHKRGTLRGLHYQRAPFAEIKLVSCTRGSIFDVAVDLRPHSPTFKKYFGLELSADNRRSLYIPHGFAHGYQTLTDQTEVSYLVSQYYHPEAEAGVRYNDPAMGIKWPITDNLVLSARDKGFADFEPKL